MSCAMVRSSRTWPPGPAENLLRVLIGPFKDTSSLLTARSDLLAAGIDCFIREY